ncbi:MAG: hypothetical protein LKF53_02080 [Solobacterium sp.]|jgi:hypothetical protein|nr:hypothetical protein [Solobacterium sp.]MCH4226759.1 hypothetical protein [Solobacterium sp.]MCH4281912.1 hypothetical protein [Solobacterium sp.]
MDKIILTEEELAAEMHVPRRKVTMFRNTGIIQGVKVNRTWIYPVETINQFFKKYAGKNLSTIERCRYEKRATK